MARIDTDLLGLQIVALDSASIVGEIDGLLIDEATLKVAGFLVDLGLYEASVLPFESAHAVGNDAVIVETAEKITEISADQRLEALAEKDVTISDAKAITRSGRTVGTIGDFFVDTATGDVMGMEFLAADKTVYPRDIAVIPASVVYRLGADIIVLNDDYDRHLLADGSSLDRLAPRTTPEPTAPEPTAIPDGPEAASVDAPADAPADAPGADAEEAGTAAEAPAATEPAETAPEGATSEDTAPAEAAAEVGSTQGPDTAADAQLEPPSEPDPVAPTADPVGPEDTFTAQQSHFLVGKRVQRRIETPDGEMVAEEGDIVTYEMVQKAKAADQLLILSLNVD